MKSNTLQEQQTNPSTVEQEFQKINWNKFWQKVVERMNPGAEAIERVQAKSLQHGYHTVRSAHAA